MSRGVLVIIVVVLLLAIAGVGLALFWKPGLLNTNTTTNATVNTANTNAAISNVNTSNGGPSDYTADVLENEPVDERVEYRGADVPVDHVEITSGYTGAEPAPEGKKVVIIYLENENLEQDVPIEQWIGQELQLLGSSGTTYFYDRAYLYPRSQRDAGQQSYLSFIVDASDSQFTLRFVRDGEDVSVDLGV